MKSTARVVVIGGGIVGCGALYHLVEKGWRDVVLVERDELTSGSTWHAAGNCPTFSTSYNVMRMQAYGVDLYGRLEAETGQPVGQHVTGSIRLAHTPQRMDEFRHVAAMANLQGLGFEVLTPAELRERYPLIELHDLEGGLWDPNDGHVDPSQVTQALAKGARDGGAEIYRQNPVLGLARTAAGEWRVETRDGGIDAEIVINAGGYRAAEVQALVGQELPVVSMEHQYLVTEDMAEIEALDTMLPLLRDPDESYYLRQERQGLILGPYERDCRTWGADAIPGDFGMELLAPDLDRLEAYVEGAMRRVPPLAEAGIKNVINGPIPYTPDGLPLIGPAHGLKNYFLCAAFSFGIVQGGGAGKLIAEIVVDGQAEWDTWEVDPRRFTDYATKRYVVERAVELYAREYDIIFPAEERPAGRPAKTTPLYDRLAAKGAMFGARGGWERATWFPKAGEAAVEQPSFRHTNWFETVGEECRAVRERVGILDLGGFAKFEVRGPGAEGFLDKLVTGRVPRPGRIALAYFCNGQGGVVSELTITSLARDCFYLCAAATAEHHDWDWMAARLPADGGVEIENLTGRYATLVLAGPKAREVLAEVTEAELSNDAFPWLSAREITIGFAPVLALRVNYVGELGWELHLPSEHQLAVYDALMAAGQTQGIADFGMYAMDSLRLEKGYGAWKLEFTAEYTALEAGLERFCRLDKADFTGRAALLSQQQQGIGRRLVCLTLSPGDADALTNAPVFRNGRAVGVVTSGGWGHTVARSIALAYIESEALAADGTIEVEVLGQRRLASLEPAALYDPENTRLKA